jgi:hypothetical protein
MTEVQPQKPDQPPRPDSMFLIGVEVPWELVEWLSWMVGGRTADALSDALFIHSPLVALSTPDEEAILATIDGTAEPPEGLTELREALAARCARGGV